MRGYSCKLINIYILFMNFSISKIYKDINRKQDDFKSCHKIIINKSNEFKIYLCLYEQINISKLWILFFLRYEPKTKRIQNAIICDKNLIIQKTHKIKIN